MNRNGRTFTQQFKSEAVRLVGQEGISVANVSRDLHINGSRLGRWVRQAEVDEGKEGIGRLTTEERQEPPAKPCAQPTDGRV